MNQNHYTLISKLTTLTLAAREATGNDGIGVTARKGRYRLMNVTYAKSGKSKVTPLSDWQSVEQCIEDLREPNPMTRAFVRAAVEAGLPANDDVGKPTKPAAALVTFRRKSRFGRAEDITVEEANRRADLANKMMQDFKRQIAEKLRK